MRHIIILNGAPKAGKGVFSKIFGASAEAGSIVNGSKYLALHALAWDGVKDGKGRELLAALYTASMAYNKLPLRDVVAACLIDSDKIGIFDVRDPSVIVKLQAILDVLTIPNTSVLIRRDDAEADAFKSSIPLDQTTGDHEYDEIIYNNGTLEELRTKVIGVFGKLIFGEK